MKGHCEICGEYRDVALTHFVQLPCPPTHLCVSCKQDFPNLHYMAARFNTEPKRLYQMIRSKLAQPAQGADDER